jgi:hypothetical protein
MNGRPMDLDPVEQSFFDAGDAADAPFRPVTEASRRHRSRRHPHRGRVRRFLDDRSNVRWRKAFLSAVLTVLTVWAGYRASMLVAARNLPDPTEFGAPGR